MQIPAQLVITDNTVHLQRCTMYKDHLCAVMNAHHICPKSWFEAAGVPITTPMASLCPTCHMNVHAAIDGTIRGRDIHHLPPRARKLAAEAFRLAMLNHLTPGLTL